jgi:hypothetical protein
MRHDPAAWYRRIDGSGRTPGRRVAAGEYWPRTSGAAERYWQFATQWVV